MSKTIISYKFDNQTVTDVGGGYSINFPKAKVVKGPGKTSLGVLEKALDLGKLGHGVVSVKGVKANRSRFNIQICFKSTNNVKSRENLVESNFVPFSIYLEPAKAKSEFHLVATVGNAKYGWKGVNTKFIKKLKKDKWYTATLAYDIDTLALFINQEIIGVHAFPKGSLTKKTNNKIFFGAWIDGKRNHFNGLLAGFKWQNEIPNQLQSIIDDRRTLAEWFITRKYESIRKSLNLGQQEGGIHFDQTTGSHTQHFTYGAIMYHSSIGMAFEIHGSIYQQYKRSNQKTTLGFLVSDEVNTTKTGGRKSLFSKGGIYWSRDTGAVSVLGQIYIDYESMGESRDLGFPIKTATNVTQGKEQLFQKVRMYHKRGEAHAFEVHGAILDQYLKSGGINRWGFPVTNESDIKKGNSVIGKFSEFERATIYWSKKTGAWEVHGDIRTKYMRMKGPLSELGFPTSNEIDIPNFAGAGRMNTFQKGSILWYGSYNSIIVARAFKIFIGRLSTKESEGCCRGQNDIYVKIKVKENSIVKLDKRMPNSGAWDGHNNKDINYTIPYEFIPNSANKVIWYRLKAWDDDGKFNANDYLGEVSKTLNAANGWGLRENNGTFTLGPSSKINSLTTSARPTIDPKTLTDSQKWWGIHNRGTSIISWSSHAKAFRDIDSETEWWDVTDWLDKAFYSLVTKDIAKGGNCFGMSLEAIYAKKLNSIFSIPLCNYNKWSGIKNEINIKHCYQASAEAIYWFLGQFTTGNTHNPKDVFHDTYRAFSQGRDPILCITQNYDFSGAPHAILPVAWDTRSKPWKITISDPNSPSDCSNNSTRILTIDPDNNTYDYLGRYKGGRWSGGRLHYIPFNVLNRTPRTPLWDLILLILSGTILIVGDDAKTVSITDEQGNDLSAFGQKATKELKSNNHIDNYFWGFKGFDREAESGAGNILIRKEVKSKISTNEGTAMLTDLDFGELVKSYRTLNNSAKIVKKNKKLFNTIKKLTPHAISTHDMIMKKLPENMKDLFKNILDANSKQNFIHKIKGNKNGGKFEYAFKHQLNEIKIKSSLDDKETIDVKMKNIGTNKQIVQLNTIKNKTAKIIINSKLGVHSDNIQLTLFKVPLQKDQKFELNVKPGLGDIEIITPNINTQIPIKLEALINGKKIVRDFNLQLNTGARLNKAQLLNQKTIHFSKIDRIFGQVLKRNIIK